MKWFKHDTDCDESEGLSYLVEQEGFAGYGRWFRLLEIVASKMDKTDRCSVEYPAKKWGTLLGLKQKKLKTFLELTENKLKTKVVHCENIITISIPNLLKKRDDYSRKSEQEPEKVTPRSKMLDVDLEIKEPKTILPVVLSHTKETSTKETSKEIILPEWIDKDLWQAWLEVRKKKRVPNTEKAIILNIKKLTKWRDAGQDINAILSRSVENGYQGLFEISGGSHGGLQVNSGGRPSASERRQSERDTIRSQTRAQLGIGGGSLNPAGSQVSIESPTRGARSVDQRAIPCIDDKAGEGGE